MSRAGWHGAFEGDRFVLARRLPVRWDVAASCRMPRVSAPRLARAVRQDVWRALRRLRGFAPSVEIAPEGQGLRVTAGGRVDGPLPRASVEARLAELLACPVRRARWTAYAGPAR
ncbi:hypothetical protein [Rhodosalinus sp. 5P4]|uniref:hypothetical protein n=1 Tax=Rhodosalinus sp. 5P4 TaxID=3239196 RepID=UPI0035254836